MAKQARSLTCERIRGYAKKDLRCGYCNKVLKVVRQAKRYCDVNCRVAASKRRVRDAEDTVESKAAAQAAVRDKAAQGLAYVLDRQARGFRWFRSSCADELEAHGLPGNRVVAAAVLGISVDTLQRRLRYGTDLLAPLQHSRRVNRMSDTPLVVPSAKVLAQIRIHPTSRDIALRRVKAAAANEPEMEV